MKRFLIGTVINAIALWVMVTLIPAIGFNSYGGDELWQKILSFLVVGAIFGLVNAIIAPIIKVIAFPLYILSFGLISFVINGALLLLVAWLSTLIGEETLTIAGFTSEGLTIESFGWAILGAIVLSIASFLTRWVFRLARLI